MPTIKLPDFDEMITYANKISDLMKQKLMLETELSFAEAEITIEATKNIINSTLGFQKQVYESLDNNSTTTFTKQLGRQSNKAAAKL